MINKFSVFTNEAIARRGAADYMPLASCEYEEVDRMTSFTVKYLDESTWQDFARLVEKNNGIFGGCWCICYHPREFGRDRTPAQRRDEKEGLVQTGRAHAAMVYDGDSAVGWCQFGATAELPGIRHQKAYDSGLTTLPDWRITCFFVDRGYRRKGVASAALSGALKEISRLGGGTVEGYADDVAGRKVSNSFLHGGIVSMFEKQGFQRVRKIGMHTWVMIATIAP